MSNLDVNLTNKSRTVGIQVGLLDKNTMYSAKLEKIQESSQNIVCA